MAIKYGNKLHRSYQLLVTLIAATLLCTIFVTVVAFFYTNAEEKAYEDLHIQTKQIKDDMALQLLSDRENLETMASFAAKLYSDGEGYDLLFDSFESIGLIENIGILMPDCVFVTKDGSVDLKGRISFEEESARGTYVSGRIPDLTRDHYEIIRSAVPIHLGGDTIGILYGVIKLDVIGHKYTEMAEKLNAQLFVYDIETGDLVIDTLHETLGNISFLQDRQYTEDYTYEEMRNNENGFSSFHSAYKDELLYLHYSELEEIGWKIMLARYESQVFASTHSISKMLFISFAAIVVVIMIYIIILMREEKQRIMMTASASKIKKLLLEINQYKSNITESLKELALFTKSELAMFFDSDGENYHYMLSTRSGDMLSDEEKKYFHAELFRYVGELHNGNQETVGLISVVVNAKMEKSNAALYAFLKQHGISKILIASVVDQHNHVDILGVVNPKRGGLTRALLEDVGVCFSIALYNKNHLNQTEIAAMTDGLTGLSNRVAYKRDIVMFDEEQPRDFSCVYIDVNELHFLNNKYGHAAGDAMLLYIANTLKEVFYGHSLYRMGGDEFLVFAKNVALEDIVRGIDMLTKQLEPMNYHVAVGMSYRTQNMNSEEMVREAELRMYEKKVQYYQDKENKNRSKEKDSGYVQMKTGQREIDKMLSLLKEKYTGIYRVSLVADDVHRILMPSYLGYGEYEKQFSKLFMKYVETTVATEYHRAMMNFLNYEALKKQLSEHKIPRITYKKLNGETVVLSIYPILDGERVIDETLWVFARV